MPDNKYIKFFFFSPNQSLISQVAAALLHGLRQSRQGQLFLQAEQVRHAENADAHSQKCINHTPEFLPTPVPASGNHIQSQEQLYRSFLYRRTRNLSRVYLLHTKLRIKNEKYVQRVKSITKVRCWYKCSNNCAQLCSCVPAAHSLVRPMLARCHDRMFPPLGLGRISELRKRRSREFRVRDNSSSSGSLHVSSPCPHPADPADTTPASCACCATPVAPAPSVSQSGKGK